MISIYKYCPSILRAYCVYIHCDDYCNQKGKKSLACDVRRRVVLELELKPSCPSVLLIAVPLAHWALTQSVSPHVANDYRDKIDAFFHM